MLDQRPSLDLTEKCRYLVMDVVNWDQVLTEIESLVITGQHEKCKVQMDLINPRLIPRNLASRFAELAARIHHSIYALKILNPYIHPENSLFDAASMAEKKTYAYALANLGSHREAMTILNSIPVEAEPEILVVKALTYFGQWNYASTIPLLQQFIAIPSVAPYRRLVAEVNLAAAYICIEDYEQALLLLDRLKAECENLNYQLLLGNCLEIEAQAYFFRSEYSLALQSLEKSQIALQKENGIYLFFVAKWRCVCRAFQSGSTEDLNHLRDLRNQAVEKDYWESVRDLDLFEAILTNNEDLARKVIMGTPAESYRQRVRRLMKTPLRPQGSYHLQIGGAGLSNDVFIFDPYKTSELGSALATKPLLYLLCQALTLDFYKPSYIAALFKSVYPHEKFNPYTSPDRIIKLLKRLDVWFETEKVPLRIKFKKSEFLIMALQPTQIVIKRGQEKSTAQDEWSELKKELGVRHFTTENLANVRSLSISSAQRLIKKGLSEGRLISIGRGRAVTYQIATKRHTNKAS